MIDMSMGFNLARKEKLKSKFNQIEYADDWTPSMAADTGYELPVASDRILAGCNAFHPLTG